MHYYDVQLKNFSAKDQAACDALTHAHEEWLCPTKHK